MRNSKIGDFKLLKCLGEGGFGQAFLAKDNNGNLAAIKTTRSDAPHADRKMLEQEAEAFKQLSHKNIAGFLHYEREVSAKIEGKSATVDYLILEAIEHGDIFDHLQFAEGFPEEICRYYFKQILFALHHMHSQGVTHRDLKLENILLDSDFNIKIIDFGLAAPVAGRDGSGHLKTNIGTQFYKPPQMLLKQFYQGPEADVWAAAVNLFAFKTANFPFSTASANDPLYCMVSGNKKNRFGMNVNDHTGVKQFWKKHDRSGNWSEEMKDFITRCLQEEPSSRMSVADCLSHPWLSKMPIASANHVKNFCAQNARDVARQ